MVLGFARARRKNRELLERLEAATTAAEAAALSPQEAARAARVAADALPPPLEDKHEGRRAVVLCVVSLLSIVLAAWLLVTASSAFSDPATFVTSPTHGNIEFAVRARPAGTQSASSSG